MHACVLNHFGHGLLCSTRLPCSWDSPGKNTGVGCCALLQGIFLIQERNRMSLVPPALARGFFTTSITWQALTVQQVIFFFFFVLLSQGCFCLSQAQSPYVLFSSLKYSWCSLVATRPWYYCGSETALNLRSEDHEWYCEDCANK